VSESLHEQAQALEAMLPQLMRRLFTLEPDHPAMDLTLSQLRVCSILQHGARTLSGIGEELGISTSAVTQIADRLERGGLAEREPDAEDRRCRLLRLTPLGAALMRARREGRVARAVAGLADLPAPVLSELISALRAVLDATGPPPRNGRVAEERLVG
jgi:DNA-binding MarR family transcriptional regulator